MLNYIIKRVLVFIPTLLIISLLTFFISLNSPGDPVLDMLNRKGDSGDQLSGKLANEKSYLAKRKELKLDLPVFYFSISSSAQSDTLYKIPYPAHREALERLSFTYGSWERAQLYYSSIRNFERILYTVSKNENNAKELNNLKFESHFLFGKYKEEEIRHALEEISRIIRSSASLFPIKAQYNALKESFNALINNKSIWRRYIPVIHFYGLKNQYHYWISGFITGNLGKSYQDGRPVEGILYEAIIWTLKLSLISILLAYVISVPVGVYCAVNKGRKSEKIISAFLFVLYSLPVFWISTLAIVFLCSGDWLSVFPAPGADPVTEDAPFYIKLTDSVHRLFLPLICLTYGSLAFISRQMRGGMLSVLSQDYIRTARAKGLSGRKVIWKHAFRNSLIPMITLFAAIFPIAVSGSLIVEYIFSIPGMGKLSYEALVARNYPVIFAVMMVVTALTLLGNLIADILYAWADPRISFSSLKV